MAINGFVRLEIVLQRVPQLNRQRCVCGIVLVELRRRHVLGRDALLLSALAAEFDLPWTAREINGDAVVQPLWEAGTDGVMGDDGVVDLIIVDDDAVLSQGQYVKVDPIVKNSASGEQRSGEKACV